MPFFFSVTENISSPSANSLKLGTNDSEMPIKSPYLNLKVGELQHMELS